MVITVNANDTDDPAYDNWNVYANLVPLNLGAGSWVEFKFMGTATGGGPRAFLDTYQNNNEYMYQAGNIPGYPNYWLNAHTYSYTANDWVYGEWFSTAANSRTAAEHSFKVMMLSDTTVQLYFDGALMGTVAAADTPSFLQYAYLGVTANIPYSQDPNGTWGPNDISPATYTDFSWGRSVPDAGSTMLLLGSALTGLAMIKRRFQV